LETSIAALQAHISQKYIGDKILKIPESPPKEEYFTLL
jgi:hypothetical protein